MERTAFREYRLVEPAFSTTSVDNKNKANTTEPENRSPKPILSNWRVCYLYSTDCFFGLGKYNEWNRAF